MTPKQVTLWKKQLPLPIAGALLIFALGAGYALRDTAPEETDSTAPSIDASTTMEQIRQQRLEFARPLLLTDLPFEHPRLAPLKQNITTYIESRVHTGVLHSASVYLRLANDGAWICINNEQTYSTGSLMKVPLLIHILKQSEADPSLLKRSIFFKEHFDSLRAPVIVEHPLTPGRSYTVEQLLQRMIIYSDNDATILLNNIAGPTVDVDICNDLHIQKPDPLAKDYVISVGEYSKFFRVLFNATYLNPPLSDYALRLLSQSAFDAGIAQPIGANIKVARKFAERKHDGITEFHEFGIVYLHDKPYLLGVMTKGNDLEALQQVVSDVSHLVYDELNGTKISF